MSSETDRDWSGELAAEISKPVVRPVTECTGRGPTKARTYLNDDLITVVLRDTLTKGERSLARRQGRARAQRAPCLPADDAR